MCLAWNKPLDLRGGDHLSGAGVVGDLFGTETRSLKNTYYETLAADDGKEIDNKNVSSSHIGGSKIPCSKSEETRLPNQNTTLSAKQERAAKQKRVEN